jgi:hypothetical protein
MASSTIAVNTTKLRAAEPCEKMHLETFMTSEQEKLALDLIHNPPPGSALAAAKEFGIDLTLLYENSKLTHTQRARKFEQGVRAMQQMRLAGERHRSQQ